MQTRSFKTLVTIADVASFGVAARRLNMTVSAVSMQMKALEQELDVALFDRSHRPPQLTIKGREIVGHARAVIAAEQALLKVCHSDGQLRGVFHIGFVLSASVRLLPRFLNAARAQMPAARFEVETGLSSDLENRILDGRLDLAVLTAGDAQLHPLDRTVLQTEELIYALPASCANKSTEWLQDNLAFLHFAPRSGIGRVIANYVASWDDRPRRTIELDGMEAIVECVKEGLGFTILPKPDVERYASETLVRRQIPEKPLSRDLALVARRGTFSPNQFKEVQNLFKV